MRAMRSACQKKKEKICLLVIVKAPFVFRAGSAYNGACAAMSAARFRITEVFLTGKESQPCSPLDQK